MCLKYKSLENTVGKGKIARNEPFFLFPQCFLPVWRTFFHFHQNLNCRLQPLSILKSLKIVIWERVKMKCSHKLLSESTTIKGNCLWCLFCILILSVIELKEPLVPIEPIELLAAVQQDLTSEQRLITHIG